MQPRAWWTTATMVAALVLGSRVASAEDGVRIDQMQPASAESPFFYAEGPYKPMPEGLEFAAGLTVEYGRRLLVEVGYDVEGNKKTLATLVEDAFLARISGSIRPVRFAAFDLSLPFSIFEHGEQPKTYGDVPHAAAATGVGDLRLGAHLRPLDTPALGVFMGGRVWVPFGAEPAYLSDQRLRAEVDAGLAGEAGRLLYGCTLSVAPSLVVRRSGDRAAAACALHVKVGEVVSVGIEPAVSFITYTNSKKEKSLQWIGEPLAAVRFRLGRFRLGFAGGTDLGGAAGAAQVRALVNFAIVGESKPTKPPPRPPSDRDMDKIPDSLDACPDEAGIPSDDPDQHGCPFRDRDADGIGDSEDYCPDRAGVPYPDKKANGCPDTDNDSFPDPVDTCKLEPGKAPDGCPRYARLTPDGFQIRPPIAFDKKDDKLTPSGRAAIEEIAATMRANPQLQPIRISVGTKGSKPKVADKHAQQILLILLGGNLDASRYEVVLQSDLRTGAVVAQLVQ